MEFYKDLYWSESLKKKKDKILRGLKKGKIRLHLYLIVLPRGNENQLEFFDVLFLRQKWFQEMNGQLRIAGIANGYDEALELVQRMTEDTLKKTGDASVRTYLEQNWK